MNYQDTMAICRVYGPPDLFLTFTCNSKWRDIANALRFEPDQQLSDRSDIVVQVFHMKVNEFIENIKEGKTFVLYTIEFQKRGLPHIHCLVWLADSNPKFSASAIDAFISAEIPDKDVDRVEWSDKSNMIKYMFEYVTKGSDIEIIYFKVTAKTSNASPCPQSPPRNEIQEYMGARFLTACEATNLTADELMGTPQGGKCATGDVADTLTSAALPGLPDKASTKKQMGTTKKRTRQSPNNKFTKEMFAGEQAGDDPAEDGSDVPAAAKTSPSTAA